MLLAPLHVPCGAIVVVGEMPVVVSADRVEAMTRLPDYVDGLRTHFVIERILSERSECFAALVCEKPGFLSCGFGSYENGAGDHIRCAWSSGWALLLGFDHESDLSPYVDGNRKSLSAAGLARMGYEGEGWDYVWPGILAGIPPELRWVAHLLTSPDEGFRAITFASWRDVDRHWCDIEPESAPGDGGRSELTSAIPHDPISVGKYWLQEHGLRVPEALVAAALRARGMPSSKLPAGFFEREDAEICLQRLAEGGVWISPR